MAGENRKTQTAKSTDIADLDGEIFIPELEEAEIRRQFWSDYEINILKKYFVRVGARRLGEYFAKDENCTNRSFHAIEQKASNLGITNSII
jgi:hypothetical protein